MKIKYFIFLLATLLHGVLWISCNGCFDSTDTDYPTMKLDSASGVVYNHFIALEDRGWNKSDSVAFNLPLFEHDADLNVTITVRYTNRYPYQNLQLVAFLAEIDTTNIITTLPLQQNDELIDSLIHRQDSLSQEKEKKEQKINERKAERDSLSQESDSLSTSKKADTASNDSVDHSKTDSLGKTKEPNTSADTVRTGDANKKESSKDSVTSGKKKIEKKESKSDAKTPGSASVDKDSLTHIIKFTLFNEKDRKNGIGMMFVESNVQCGTIHLKANTRYKIFITHNMKEQWLKGITDIGVELKGCKKQPIDKMSTKWWEKSKE